MIAIAQHPAAGHHHVARLRRGRQGAEVQVELPGSRTLVASVTLANLKRLGLRVGSACTVRIDPSHVLLAVTD